jgi:hypothetical protein
MDITVTIILSVLATITAVATTVTTVSETLPFIQKISGNGVVHTIYHILNKEKCVDIIEEKA